MTAIRNGDHDSSLPTERTPLLANGTQETQLTVPASSMNDGEGHSTQTKAPIRQIAPDLLRGLLMIFMAEDHVNATAKGYPHGTSLGSEDSTRVIKGWTNTLGYIMRTISHLCAPGFTMLLGMGIAFFIASRANSGWKPIQFIKHIIYRFFGIIIGNYIACFPIVLMAKVWLPNVVLVALALDYLFVGLIAIGLLFIVEPLLEKVWSSILKEEQIQSINPEQGQQSTPPTYSKAKQAAFHTANVFLFLLSAYTLYLTIQVDPKHGDCKRKPISINGSMDMENTNQIGQIYDALSFFIKSSSAPPKWVQEHNCTNVKSKLFFNVLFYPTICHGILSVFPPMAWLPMAIFGLLYGRLLVVRTARLSNKYKQQQRSQIVTIQESLYSVTLESVLAILFAGLFVCTRLFHFGNLSENCLPTNPTKQTNSYLLSIKAFFYVVKYPPSPSFVFLTLSGNFVLLVVLALASSSITSPKRLVGWLRSDNNPLLVFGRQSLFFYVVHLLIAGFVGPLLLSNFGHKIPKHEWDGESSEIGIGLGTTFFVSYAVLLVIMYPLCKAYAKFKSRQPSDSIWRFF